MFFTGFRGLQSCQIRALTSSYTHTLKLNLSKWVTVIRAITQMLSMWRPFLSPTHVGSDEFHLCRHRAGGRRATDNSLHKLFCINILIIIFATSCLCNAQFTLFTHIYTHTTDEFLHKGECDAWLRRWRNIKMSFVFSFIYQFITPVCQTVATSRSLYSLCTHIL